MSTGLLVAVIVAIVVVLIVVAAGLLILNRSHRLRERFGPEYDRMLGTGENRRAVERELRDRERRHDDLDLRPLTPEARDQFAKEWAAVQEKFIDSPGGAVREADQLVSRLMHERGYPTDGYEQQVKDLSVEHGHCLTHYREAHEIGLRAEEQQATTEDLRNAMVHYRTVFDDLLDQRENA